MTKRLRKRAISIVLMLTMVFTLFPTTAINAYAAEDNTEYSQLMNQQEDETVSESEDGFVSDENEEITDPEDLETEDSTENLFDDDIEAGEDSLEEDLIDEEFLEEELIEEGSSKLLGLEPEMSLTADNVSTYTLQIPSTLTVSAAGWNETSGLTAAVSSGDTFDSGKKLTVTAASANSWALKSGENSVGYNLATAEAAYSSSATPASWDFSADELNASGGTNKVMGINVQDYTTMAIPAGEYSDTVTFTAKVLDARTPVTAITLNKNATNIAVGNSETLRVSTVTPDNATDKTVTWSSDNETVATVNATTGEVTAVSMGTANITATANDGSGVTATCAVNVNTVVIIWNYNDIVGSGNSFTKDGVTVTAGRYIDFRDKNVLEGGTFTTTLGNFTKIVVSGGYTFAGPNGTGWSNRTWTGNASSVTFTNDIMGAGQGNLKFVFTIGPVD